LFAIFYPFFSRVIKLVQNLLPRLYVGNQKLSESEKREQRIQKIQWDFLNEEPDVPEDDAAYAPWGKLWFALQDALEESKLSQREKLTTVKFLLQMYSRILAEKEEEIVSNNSKLHKGEGK